MIQATIILILIILAYQDWQSREVSWPLIIILAGLFVWQNYIISEWTWISNSLNNIFFFGINLLGVTLYFSFKSRKWVNIFKNYFGLGDLLLLLAFCMTFNFTSYMLFFVGGMLFSIASHFILSRIFKMSLDNLPLVTYFSIFYLTLFTFHILFVENFDFNTFSTIGGQ